MTMRRLLLLLIASSLAIAYAPSASAAAAGCAVSSPGAPIPSATLVTAPFTPAMGGACVGGLVFTSLITAACPATLTPVGLAGEYCGALPGYAPGTTVTCTGVVTTVGATFTHLVVGLDAAPWDGNINVPPGLFGEPLGYDGGFAAPSHTVTMRVPGPLPARAVAYPVGVVGTPTVLVDCQGTAAVINPINPIHPHVPPGACGNFGAGLAYADCNGTLPHGGKGCSGIYDGIDGGSAYPGTITPYVQLCDSPWGGKSVCIGAIREPPGTWDETCIDPLSPGCKVYQEGGTTDGQGDKSVRRTDILGGETWETGRTFQQTYWRCLLTTNQT
jgi:hypothetical protein